MARRRITVQARNVDELRAKAPRVTLESGSTGRVELVAPRVGGICPVPLGPLMGSPFAGTTWANALAPKGAVVTDRGGISNVGPDCDAFVEWAIPQGQAQAGQARMGLVVSLIVLIGAFALALGALGWAISQIRLTVDAILPDSPIGFAAGGLGLALGIGLIVFGLGMTGQNKGKR